MKIHFSKLSSFLRYLNKCFTDFLMLHICFYILKKKDICHHLF